MCFSCSLAIAASPLVVQDHDDGPDRDLGWRCVDARAQSSRSCARSSADLRLRSGHSHRRTRSRSSERDRAVPLRVRPPLERGAASICRMRSFIISAGVQPASRSMNGPSIQMAEGDFVLVVRGEPHVLRSGRSDKADPAGRSRSMAGACRRRAPRRWAKAIFDDDLRSLQSGTPITEQRVGIATAGSALEARGGSRMARDNPAADGNRGSAPASRPARCALADDRGALCRGAA